MNTIEDAYQSALDYLYSFVDFSMQKVNTYSPERFKLERMQALVASLEAPQQAYPSIHVAGTKGKGSVSILCASALQSAGYNVGLYTSPHLDDYAERIQVNAQFIPHGELAELVDEIKPYVKAIPELTTFEITTALAFMYFARKKVTAAVIEVGLGGRLDATNVIVPKVSVITSISYDHTHLLGNTLSQIATEKAGIIKPGIPVIVSPQDPEAWQVINRIADGRASPLIQVGQDIQFEEISHSLDGQMIRVWRPDHPNQSRIEFTIPFLGHHQVVNAVTAYAALDEGNQLGIPISTQAVKDGFASAFWPGRFEVVQKSPPVILDCAHNRDSALKLRLTLEKYFPGTQVSLVFGASEDKDIQGMLIELTPAAKELIFVKSFHPRAIDVDKLVEMAQSYGLPIHCFEHIPEALEKVQASTGKDGAILVTGSIFVVAEARKYWESKANIRRY